MKVERINPVFFGNKARISNRIDADIVNIGVKICFFGHFLKKFAL